MKQLIAIILITAATLAAQAKIDLRTQTKDVDFSAASSTKPAKTGASTPSTCFTGEMFFSTTATAGQNIYLCTATNTWTQLVGGSGGGGGGTSGGPIVSTQMLDFQPTLTNSTTLTIGEACSTDTPCRWRVGTQTFSLSAPGIVTVPSPSTISGMAYIYLSSSGALTVGDMMGCACTSGCTEIAGLNQFPGDSIPIGTWTSTLGAWDTNGFYDLRAWISQQSVTSGIGIITAHVLGATVVSADTSVLATRVAPPATAADACNVGSYAIDASFLYQCVATNTWRRTALGIW